MKFNKNTIYEKRPEECPRRCDDCEHFHQECGICTANGCSVHTYNFSNPKDRPLPMPLNCYWWYLNNVWDKLSPAKIEEYREERRHLIVAWIMLKKMKPSIKELHAFVDHLHRQGGYGLIDFNVYPEAKAIYKEVFEADGGKTDQ